MVDILLLILKILLWVILAVLGIAIFIICLVLFAPVSYKADIYGTDNDKIRAKVNFLVVSFSVLYDRTAKKLDTVLKICGISFGKKDKQEKKKRVKRRKKTDDTTKIEENYKCAENAGEDDVITDSHFEKSYSDKAHDAPEDAPLKKEHKKQQKKQRKKAPKTLKKEKTDKLEQLKKMASRFGRFWSLECTKKTRTYLKKYIIKSAKHVSPRHIKGYLIYGFDDPAATGNVTGYLSLMPFCYQKDFSLAPDFYNKVIECKVKIKGHFFIGYFLRIIFNINIWRTVFAAKKYLTD